MRFFKREKVHVIQEELIDLGELFIELFTREENVEPAKVNKTPATAKFPGRFQKIRNAFRQRLG